MTEIFNQQWSIERRRELRNKPTKAERRLWFYLRGKQVLGITVRRQYNIGNYIADFYIPSLRLIIEVDGAYHNLLAARVYDRERALYFTELGLLTVRFTNDEVFTDIDNVLIRLKVAIGSRASTPPLLKRGNKGASEPRRGDLLRRAVSSDTSSP